MALRQTPLLVEVDQATGVGIVPQQEFVYRIVSAFVSATMAAGSTYTFILELSTDGITLGEWFTPSRVGAAGTWRATLATQGHNTQARRGAAPIVDMDCGTLPADLWINDGLDVTFRMGTTSALPTGISRIGLVIQREWA